ncbi:MAG TPA: lysophospholipid acyltransferase family protein [Polyangiaceae bacterium]|nr:lysophospholipid acyltransferase family protein [Polyangiaceae bacterium]
MMGPLNTAFSLSFTLAMSEAAVASSILDPSGETTRKLARFWGARLCRTCGVEIATRGGEGVAWHEPLIVMANHQSYLDIPVLYAALPEPFGMLAKQELFRLPIFSAAMRGLRCIPIDRGNVRQSLASLRKAADQIRSGNSIVVFPEGTRSSDGSLSELKTGPFYLAEMAGVPIVPIGIRGTGRALAKGSLLVDPARVEVRIGDPILPASRGPAERDRLRKVVRTALEDLCGGEARSGSLAPSITASTLDLEATA